MLCNDLFFAGIVNPRPLNSLTQTGFNEIEVGIRESITKFNPQPSD